MITKIDKNTALVLIDLQKGIVSSPTAHPVNEILKNTARLIDAFHMHSLPVVVVNVNPKDALWTKTRKEISTVPANSVAKEVSKVAMNLVAFTDIVPEIHTLATDIFVTKHTWNAFFETSLHAELQKLSLTGIVLCGISTSIGVEGTARAASELGYNITFVLDAMTDRIEDAHNNSIRHIFPRIGELGTTDEVLKYLI